MAFSIRWSSKELKNLTHEGFAHGSQNCQPDNALLEIDAYVNQEKADTELNYVEDTKLLEGKLEQLARALPEVEARWRDVQQQLGDHAPAVVLPTGLAVGGIFALCAEAVMLAPSLDPYGVVDPVAQYVFASGIALASSIFFHYAYEASHKEAPTRLERLLVWCFGTGAVTALSFFGIVRGRQIAFVGELSQNPVGAFLGRYPFLSSIVFVFLTLCFPIAAAVAITSGLERIRNWKLFVSARRAFSHVSKQLPVVKKQLESEKEKLGHQLKSLDEKRKRWQRDYLVHHEKGTMFGARQMPLWMVWLKAGAASTLAGCAFYFLFPFCILLATTVFVITWVYFYYERNHPTPAQQFKHQNIQFKNAFGASDIQQMSDPLSRLRGSAGDPS